MTTENGGQHRWMKFWPQDWENDECLKVCSLAARGLWVAMICLMHRADPYGHLLVNGRPPTERKLAQIVGSSEREVTSCLRQLEDEGVFSRADDGTIFSRRMVKDKRISEQAREYGKGGGNPALKRRGKGKGLNRGVNPHDNPPGYTQEAEAESRSRIPLPPYDLEGVEVRPEDGRPVVNGRYLDETWERVAEAAGIDRASWRGDLSPVVAWLQADIPMPAILAAVRRIAERAGYVPPRSLAYFDPAVREQPRRAA